MAKIRFRIQFDKVDKKTGKVSNTSVCTDIVEAESQPLAIAKVKTTHKAYNINIVSVTPYKT